MKTSLIIKMALTLLLISGTGHLFLRHGPWLIISNIQAPYGMFTTTLRQGGPDAVKLYDADSGDSSPLNIPGKNFIASTLIPYKALLLLMQPTEKNLQSKALQVLTEALCREQKNEKKWKLIYQQEGGKVEKFISCAK